MKKENEKGIVEEQKEGLFVDFDKRKERPDIFVFGAVNLEGLKENKRVEEKKKESLFDEFEMQNKKADIFVFGGENYEGLKVVKEKEEAGVFFFGREDNEDVASEILYKGDTVQQVGEAPTPPEPEEIHFLHRMHGKLFYGGNSGGTKFGGLV